MIVAAWDIGHSTGVAVGPPGHAPKINTVRMPDPIAGDFSRANDCFMRWADDWISTFRPDRLYIEAPFAAARRTGVDLQAYIEQQFFYAGVADGYCRRHLNIGVDRVRVNHVRQHFCDNGGAKDPEIKAACEALGWKPADSHQADSLALWHFAIDDQLDLEHPFTLPHQRPQPTRAAR